MHCFSGLKTVFFGEWCGVFPSLYRRRTGPACLFGEMAVRFDAGAELSLFGENFGRKQLLFFKNSAKNGFFGHVLFLDFPVFSPSNVCDFALWGGNKRRFSLHFSVPVMTAVTVVLIAIKYNWLKINAFLLNTNFSQ